MKLDQNMSLPDLTAHLQQLGWLKPTDEAVALEKPGEGNMNVVFRVLTTSESLILKQANPFVQKYPSIPAPLERIATEAKFYEFAKNRESIQDFLPLMIGYDADNHLLALEDLGSGVDYTFLYQSDLGIDPDEAAQLIDFLILLHQIDFSESDRQAYPDNLTLRKLNYEHLFVFPYALDHGFDLDTIQPGLQELALPYKNDEDLKKAALALGEVYLSTGSSLLHGDFYPGSWLFVEDYLQVIDPEFSFFGPPEYDLGVMLAHLLLMPTPVALIDDLLNRYQAQLSINERLVEQFIGMEIIRRLIGLAQLPLVLDLNRKSILLEAASALLLGKITLPVFLLNLS